MSKNSNSKCKMLLCLALPLTLAVGYASDASLPPATSSFIAVPNAIVQPVSARRTANIVVGNEIFNMFMTETNVNNGLTASVNNGVVTLSDPLSDKSERQTTVNQISELAGVNQVKDKHGADLVSTTTEKAVAVR